MWHVLADHEGRDDVMFTTGEPTLNPNLAAYIGWARDLGYGRIGVTTNGRRLGYEEYTRSLLDRGLNHLVISVHGPDARTHDGLTRLRGSFDQVLAGMRLLARLKPEYGVSIHTSTVVTTRNFRRFPELYDLLRSLSVDQVVFNMLQPLGRAACLATHLGPHYSETVQELRRLVETVGADCQPPMFFVDLPLCVSEGLPNHMRGWLEVATFIQYADDGAPEQRPRAPTRSRSTGSSAPSARPAATPHTASASGATTSRRSGGTRWCRSRARRSPSWRSCAAAALLDVRVPPLQLE